MGRGNKTPGSPTSVLHECPGESDVHPTTTKADAVEQIDDILSTIGLMRFSSFNQDSSEEKLLARLEAILASGLPAGALARAPFAHPWPLLHAVEVGSIGAAKLLLEYGSHVDAPGGGAAATVDRTPLGAAVFETAQPQMVELLLYHGANPFVQRPASSPAPRSPTRAGTRRPGRDKGSRDDDDEEEEEEEISRASPRTDDELNDEPPFWARRRVCMQMLERARATPHTAGQAECSCLHHNWGHDPESPVRKRRRGGGGCGYYTGSGVEMKAPPPAPPSDDEMADEVDERLTTDEVLEPPPFAPAPSALGKRPLRDCIEYSLTGGGPLSGALRALGGRPAYRPSPLGPGVRPCHMSIGFGHIWAMSSSLQFVDSAGKLFLGSRW